MRAWVGGGSTHRRGAGAGHLRSRVRTAATGASFGVCHVPLPGHSSADYWTLLPPRACPSASHALPHQTACLPPLPHACSYAAAGGYGDDDAMPATAVAQQGLMPTAADPKLWVVRCGEGQEREAVVCLLQKCYDLARKGNPLLIKAVFCQDHLKVGGWLVG